MASVCKIQFCLSFSSSCGLNDDDDDDAYDGDDVEDDNDEDDNDEDDNDDDDNDEDDNDDDDDGGCKRASHGPLCGFPASTLRLTVDPFNCILCYILLHSSAFLHFVTFCYSGSIEVHSYNLLQWIH